MAMSTFDRAISSIRRAIVTRVRNNKSVSSVDVTKVARSVAGSSRGAAVRTAFRQLTDERMIRRTNKTVYNSATHHSVSVYVPGRNLNK